MSERQLTIMERWALAIGAPVIAAAILSVWALIWQMHQTQMELTHRVDQVLESALTRAEAREEIDPLRYRLDEHDDRLRALEEGGGR